MSTIVNGMPQVILEGTRDLSVRTLPPEPLAIPIHLPLFFCMAEKGPLTTQLGALADLKKIYGAKSFDVNGSFSFHYLPYLEKIGATGNALMLKRLVSKDAKKANISLWLQLTPAELPVYKRDEEGRYLLGEDSRPVVVPDLTVSGYNIRWVMKEGIGVDGGTLEGANGLQYEYPVFDFEASHFGAYGNHVGFRFGVPSSRNGSPPDQELTVREKALMCRMQIVERADALSSPLVIETQSGERFVDFTLKPAVVDQYNIEKDIENVLVDSYQSLDDSHLPPVYADIGFVHFYRDNFLKIAELVKTSETTALTNQADRPFFMEPPELYEVNLFTAKTLSDQPYYSLAIDNGEGSCLLSERSTHYLTGGSDGALDNAVFDKLVAEVMSQGWQEVDDPLVDMGLNPFSFLWDTGFSINTKKSLCEALGQRKDVAVALSTFIDGEPSPNWAEEESLANVLKAYASGYPESQVYGTACCRAIVIGGQGTVNDGSWKRPASLSLDLACKMARYMGAGDGSMKTAYAFDLSPNNQIEFLKDITGSFKPIAQRQKDWNAGMIWAQAYDRRSDFFPQFQTVYPDDTSVLNSLINMIIMITLQKVCDSTWKDLTGSSTYTSAELIEKSDELIRSRVANRFDSRVVIEPETYLAATDVARGYSWSCNIHMYANNMKTVGVFTIVAHRMDDLES